MQITLDMLLASRDSRQQTQQSLLRQHPDRVLVCLTVVMPGRVKRNSLSLVVADAAYQAVLHSPLSIEGEPLVKDLETGFEAYFLVSASLLDTKRITCSIEESHPLGRLFDLDVIGQNGIPVSRSDIGMPPRHCLLCEHEARYCMRNHTHTQEEIQEKIHQLVKKHLSDTPNI